MNAPGVASIAHHLTTHSAPDIRTIRALYAVTVLAVDQVSVVVILSASAPVAHLTLVLVPEESGASLNLNASWKLVKMLFNLVELTPYVVEHHL